jgi:hypothetical protein
MKFLTPARLELVPQGLPMVVERLLCFDKALLSEAEGLSTNGSNINGQDQ